MPLLETLHVRTALLCLLVLPMHAMADTGPEAGENDWSFRAGLGVYSAPDYSGSDSFETMLFPSIDVTYRDLFFASVIDGVGFNVIRQESWGATLSGQIVMGRESEGDIATLEPIEDRVMPKVEVFADTGPVRLHASVIGDGKRNSAEAGAQYLRQASPRSVYLIGGGVRWNNRDWNDERFSVGASDAADLGVTPYAADAALSEVYVEGAYVYYLSPVYVLEVALEVAELTDDPADSPLVEEFGTPTQPSLFLRINRQF